MTFLLIILTLLMVLAPGFLMLKLNIGSFVANLIIFSIILVPAVFFIIHTAHSQKKDEENEREMKKKYIGPNTSETEKEIIRGYFDKKKLSEVTKSVKELTYVKYLGQHERYNKPEDVNIHITNDEVVFYSFWNEEKLFSIPRENIVDIKYGKSNNFLFRQYLRFGIESQESENNCIMIDYNNNNDDINQVIIKTGTEYYQNFILTLEHAKRVGKV